MMFIPASARRFAGCLSLHMLVLLGCNACETTALRGLLEDTSAQPGWNEEEARSMAEAVVQEMLEHPWRLRFSQFAGRAPVIIVGPLLNRTHDQLHTQALLKELQRALVNSGQFQAVADAGQRQEVRQERAEQGPPSRPESLKSGLQEPGADFILQGSISIMVERHENTTTTSYQVSLELLDIASAIKVWVGQKKLKPLLARGQTTL